MLACQRRGPKGDYVSARRGFHFRNRVVVEVKLCLVPNLLADSSHCDAKITKPILLKRVILKLEVLVVLLEGYRIEVRLKDLETVYVDVGHLLKFCDDVGPEVPNSGQLCRFFLHRDHPRPLQVLEGIERGLFLCLRLLLLLQQRLLLLLVAALHSLHYVREDVGDFALHLLECFL